MRFNRHDVRGQRLWRLTIRLLPIHSLRTYFGARVKVSNKESLLVVAVELFARKELKYLLRPSKKAGYSRPSKQYLSNSLSPSDILGIRFHSTLGLCRPPAITMASLVLPYSIDSEEILNETFRTSKEGLAAVNTFVRPHGYAVSTLRSKVNTTGAKKRAHICCDRRRKPKPNIVDNQSTKKRRRNNTSQAVGCPFAMSLRLDLQANLWHLTHGNAAHNHLPSPSSTHPAQRAAEVNE